MKKFFYTLLVSVANLATGWAADKLPSLCDEWNIVVPPFTATDPFHTYTQYLESDTIISGKLYVKLLQEDLYKGALREESNATIYYIPSGSTHDYLLYAFNAKEGDVFIGISTSGNSKNIVMALEEAKKKGVITVGLVGEKECDMDQWCDYIIHVPSGSTPTIQESHIMIGHIVCALVEDAIFSKVGV